MAMLEVRDLHVQFKTDDGLVKAVDGLSFSLERGQTLGIVGESGSGKSVTSLSVMGLHRGKGTEITGQILLDGEDLVSAKPERVRQLRGSKMAMIFQDPLSALHPYYTVGSQIIEAYQVHNKVTKQVARKRAIDLLGRVGIPHPAGRVDDYPHQFSGGMRQRAMIAMALSCDPELLIADEPTTALDVTVQAQILDLIVDLQAEFGSGVIIITHDLGVVAEVADEVLVMYAGRVAETGSADDLFHRPGHPYAWGLLGSMPRLDAARIERLRPIPGTPPSLINVPAGCPFHPRCTYPPQATLGSCDSDIPTLREVNPGHRVACHLTTSRMRETWQRLSDPTQSGETTDPVAAADPVDDAEAAATPAGQADYAEPYGPSDPNGPDGSEEPIFPTDPNYPSIANLTSPADPAYPTEPTGSSEVEA
jgi:peptide/nickel transport system ATP-binding protein